MWTRTEKTENERYLERELEDAKAQLEHDRQERQREIHQHRIDFNARMNESYRTADSWREALRKQSSLMWKEAGMEPDMNPEEDYFLQGHQACDRALEIWDEVAPSKLEEKARLRERLEAIEFEIRQEVSAKLLAERDNSSWNSIANQLADPDLDPNDWLNW